MFFLGKMRESLLFECDDAFCIRFWLFANMKFFFQFYTDTQCVCVSVCS